MFPILMAVSLAVVTAGWENVNPARKGADPVRVLWRADLSQGLENFKVTKADGAEGTVSVVSTPEGKAIRIVKSNDRGYLTVETKTPIAFAAGTHLQAFASVSGSKNDPEASIGCLRMFGNRRTLAYFRNLDGRGSGGPRMAYLFNTPRGASERKLCRFPADAKTGTNITAVIAVAGARSDSIWRDWGIEDLKAAERRWDELARATKEARAHQPTEPQDEAAFAAALAADSDHCAKVVSRDGLSRLTVDGREVPAIIYKGITPHRKEEGNLYFGAKMDRAGIHLQAIPIRFGDSPQKAGFWSAKGFDAKGAAEEIRRVMRLAPNSLFLLSMSTDAYPEFSDEHPDEVWCDADGRKVWGGNVHADHSTDPGAKRKNQWPWMSYHSLVWREAVKRNISALVEELRAQGLAKRVVGVHIAGYHDGQFATILPDYSKPAVEGFRAWQKREYGCVKWETAPVFEVKPFFTPGKDDREIAFTRFLKTAPMDMQNDIARHAKRCLGKDAIAVRWCMSPYGGTFNAAYDIVPFLKSDAMDVLVAQPSYERRTPGCALGQRLPLPSFHRHGKLYLDEFDLRTYGGVHYGETELRVTGLSQAVDDVMWGSIHRKLAGTMLAQRMGWWYFDMAGGWFEPDGIAADIADTVRTVGRFGGKPPSPWRPSAAFVIDETGALLRNTAPYRNLLDEEMVFKAQLPALGASGVPYDYLEMDDLLADPSLAKGYRTIVFGGMYCIDEARRKLIDSLKGGRRTLVFLAGTGHCGGADATGFRFESREGPCTHRTVAEPDTRFNVLGRLGLFVDERMLGAAKLHPFWEPNREAIAVRPGVRVLARATDGDPILAEADHKGWKGVSSVSAAGLTPQHFRKLVAESGGYVPAPYGLAVEMNGDFLMVHAFRSGHYDFKLPRPCAVTNLRTGRPESVQNGVLPLDLTVGETCWFALQ